MRGVSDYSRIILTSRVGNGCHSVGGGGGGDHLWDIRVENVAWLRLHRGIMRRRFLRRSYQQGGSGGSSSDSAALGSCTLRTGQYTVAGRERRDCKECKNGGVVHCHVFLRDLKSDT